VTEKQVTIVGTLVFLVIGMWAIGLTLLASQPPRPVETVAAMPADETVGAVTPPTLAASPLPPSATPTRYAAPSPAPLASPTATRTLQPTRPAASTTPAVTAAITLSLTVTVTPSIPPTPLPASALTLTPPASGRYLLVSQDEQKLHVYENGVEIRTIPVSTGAPVANAFTPAWRGHVGTFWGGAAFRNSNLWADYIWYLFPGEQGSILIHSVPYTRNGESKIYDRPEALGVEPASRGCIRISPEDAEWLAAWNPVGALMEITPWSGDIAPADDTLWPKG